MVMDPHYPQVNGAKVSFVSMEFKLSGGYTLTGIKRISYKDRHTIGHISSPSTGKLIGRTRGFVVAEGEIEIYHDQRLALLSFLDAVGNGQRAGYSLKSCTFDVCYAEEGDAGSHSDTLTDVRFHSLETSGAEGVEAITCTLQMDVFGGISWDGIPAIRPKLVTVG
jgi:hypothetical protein